MDKMMADALKAKRRALFEMIQSNLKGLSNIFHQAEKLYARHPGLKGVDFDHNKELIFENVEMTIQRIRECAEADLDNEHAERVLELELIEQVKTTKYFLDENLKWFEIDTKMALAREEGGKPPIFAVKTEV